MEEWGRALRQHKLVAGLYTKYFMFLRADYAEFSLDRYLSAIQTACARIEQDFKTLCNASAAPDDSKGESNTFYNPIGELEVRRDMCLLVCLRQAVQMWQSLGYAERALALLQMLVEWSWARPDAVADKPTTTQKQFLEAFWESEAPRVGEPGGMGWDIWLHDQQAGMAGEGDMAVRRARLQEWQELFLENGDLQPVDDASLLVQGVLGGSAVVAAGAPTEGKGGMGGDGMGGSSDGVFLNDSVAFGVLGQRERTLVDVQRDLEAQAQRKAELERLVAEGKMARDDLAHAEAVMGEKQWVYSRLHGHRIPARDPKQLSEADEDTSLFYKKILGELHEDLVTEGLAGSGLNTKAQRRLARKGALLQPVRADDAFLRCTWKRMG